MANYIPNTIRIDSNRMHYILSKNQYENLQHYYNVLHLMLSNLWYKYDKEQINEGDNNLRLHFYYYLCLALEINNVGLNQSVNEKETLHTLNSYSKLEQVFKKILY